jgi:hypothetical protein
VFRTPPTRPSCQTRSLNNKAGASFDASGPWAWIPMLQNCSGRQASHRLMPFHISELVFQIYLHMEPIIFKWVSTIQSKSDHIYKRNGDSPWITYCRSIFKDTRVSHFDIFPVTFAIPSHARKPPSSDNAQT